MALSSINIICHMNKKSNITGFGNNKLVILRAAQRTGGGAGGQFSNFYP